MYNVNGEPLGRETVNNVKNYVSINPFPFEWVLRALIDFILSNARRFYSSMGNLLDCKGLSWMFSFQGNSGQKSYDAYVVVVSTKNLIFLSQISTGMASARAAEQEGQGAAAALPQSKNGGGWRRPLTFRYQKYSSDWT